MKTDRGRRLESERRAREAREKEERVGAREALPALMEIAGSKGFFSGRSNQEKLKIAAGKAASITRR